MRILCATDLLPKSEAAVERAGMMARQLGARLCIVHVLASERDERKARIALVHLERRFRATLGKDGMAPSILLRSGNRASQLIRVVQQIVPDLVVLGPRRRRWVRDRLGETLAERIQSTHRCPLLIVKHRSVGNYRNILLALDLSPAAKEIIRAAQSIVLKSGMNASVVHAHCPWQLRACVHDVQQRQLLHPGYPIRAESNAFRAHCQRLEYSARAMGRPDEGQG